MHGTSSKLLGARCLIRVKLIVWFHFEYFGDFFVRILSVPRHRRLRCPQVKGWISSSSVSRHLSPSGTKCKDQDQNQDHWIGSRWGIQPRVFFFFFFLYASNHVTSDTALDVSADMSFGHRFFLIALFLGIVPSRFGHCNQGEFNEDSRI